jgi:hypothetical protein
VTSSVSGESESEEDGVEEGEGTVVDMVSPAKRDGTE